MNYDQNSVRKSKAEYRTKLAKKPIAEKLELLEEIVERSLATRKDTSKVLPDSPWEIPANWKWRTMGEVAQIVGGGTPKTSNPQNFGGNIPWITPADLSKYTAKTITQGSRNITPEGLKGSGARLLPKGTVLFSSRAPIGYVAIAANEVATNQGFKSFILNQNLLPDYVYHYLHRARNLANDLASGTTFLEISGKNAARLPIPVAPLPEQRRIVARIEELFSRLDAGVAALRQAKAQLQRYRQSVLAAAVTGQLTQAWREQHPDTEPAKDLLERILKQHREQWNGRGKYKAAPPLDAADLPDLPSSWAWGTTTQIFSEIKDGTHDTPKYQASGIPFITQKHIKPQGLVFDDYKYISKADHDHFYTRSNPEEGDILISMIGVNRGQSCIVPSTEIFSIKNVGLFKPHRTLTNVKFLQASISSLPGQQRLLKTSKGGAQPFVGLNELRTWALPLPPLAEQHQIVAEVESRTTAIDHLEAELDRQITRSNRLRQSTLTSAFAGKFSKS